jgi:nucleotide-binding universal stress UspA family protein
VDIKTILLFLRAGEPDPSALALATGLARNFDAEVEAVCLFSEPIASTAESFAIGRQAVGEVFAHLSLEVRQMVAPTEAAFHKAIADCGWRGSWSLADQGEPGEVSALRARFADLVVVERTGACDPVGRDLAQALVLAGGTPCLIAADTPSRSEHFDRIIVAWNGSREAKRALDDALVLLKQASAVEVVVIGDRPAALFGHPQGETLIRRLARHGVKAEFKTIAGTHKDVGEALLQRTHAFGADLLVMGAYSHSKTAETVLGGTTRTVLTHAPVPVFMSH